MEAYRRMRDIQNLLIDGHHIACRAVSLQDTFITPLFHPVLVDRKKMQSQRKIKKAVDTQHHGRWMPSDISYSTSETNIIEILKESFGVNSGCLGGPSGERVWIKKAYRVLRFPPVESTKALRYYNKIKWSRILGTSMKILRWGYSRLEKKHHRSCPEEMVKGAKRCCQELVFLDCSWAKLPPS